MMEPDQELQQQIDSLERIVKAKLTKEAFSRYSNIKIAHPDKAMQLLAVLGAFIQQNQLEKVDDALLKEIILKITPQKKEIRIVKR